MVFHHSSLLYEGYQKRIQICFILIPKLAEKSDILFQTAHEEIIFASLQKNIKNWLLLGD
jgi:hypothetical protein